MSSFSNRRLRKTFSQLASKRRWLRDQLQRRPILSRRRQTSFEQLEVRALLATITVTSLADNLDSDGSVTLREAIQAAETDMSVDGSTAGNGADTIVFSPSLTESGGATITLGGTELTIATPIAISGPGADRLAIDAGDNSRIFQIDDGEETTEIDVNISGLTLTGGNATTGGAILSHENLTLTSSTISGNSADSNGGGIWNDGTATITNSTISGNSAVSLSGGGIYNSGTANVTGSTIADNSAVIGGGGIYNRNLSATATISGSSISGNSASVGGGICNTGTGTATITNSTISGNSADDDGGGIYSNGTATVTGSTITGNSAGDSGGGIFNNSTATSIDSTIVAGNRLTTGAADDLSGNDLESTSTHNLIGDPASAGGLVHDDDGDLGTGTNNIVGQDDGSGGRELIDIDTVLGPLAFNGGPTQTHALLATSPAINAGSSSETNDQRGAPFARDDGGGVDIGAYERQTVATLPSPLVVTTLDDELDADPLGDPDDVSLREALGLANGSIGLDTITFASSLTAGGPATIFLTLGELLAKDAVTISGPGANLLTIDAQGNSRIFHFDDGVAATEIEVNISGLTLTGGHATDGVVVFSQSDNGGAILSLENLTLSDSTIFGNTAASSGGGIYNSGTATVLRSAIAGNSAERDGGGIFNQSLRTVTVTSSTISGNTSGDAGGGIGNAGTLSINGSTITGNVASGYGGGIVNFADSSTMITVSTISRNTSQDGGGGIFGSELTVTLRSTIVAGNQLTSGISNDISGSSSPVSPDSSHNLIGDPASDGGLIHDDDGDLGTGTNNIVGQDDGSGGRELIDIDTVLGPLAFNGGPTLTHALLATSPAINAGSSSETNDQRGAPFARDDGGGVDIGAYERQTVATLPSPLVVTTLDDELDADPLGDPDDVSLREAMGMANGSIGPDEITFAASLTDGGGATILLTLGELLAKDAVTISGPGADLLIIDAQSNSRIFHVDDGDSATEIEVEISGLTLTGGNATDGDNSSASEADYGGAILSRENLTLTGSAISDNSAGFGGGLFNDGGALTLTGSTISGNSALFDGGGLWSYKGSATITNSTVSGNAANRDGGGLVNSHSSGSLTISNSTIVGNRSDADGDDSGSGGGLFTNDASNFTTLFNTIVAGNLTGTGATETASDLAGKNVHADSAYNLIGDPASAGGLIEGTDGNLVGDGAATPALLPLDQIVDPALADNGGSTLTHQLVPGSRAIEAGNGALLPSDDQDLDGDGDTTEPLPWDQVGNPRIVDLPGIDNLVDGLDIGAMELVDETPPDIIAPTDITVEGDTTGGAGETNAAITAFLAAATADDLVDPNPVITDDAPATFPLGDTIVTFTATDASGNDATATATVTVVDTTEPTLTVPADITVEGDTTGGAGETNAAIVAFLAAATADDLVDPNPVITDDAPATFPLGDTIVTFTATDASGNEATATATVTVVDTTEPTLTVPADITVNANVPGGAAATLPAIAAFLSNASATDVVDSMPVITHDAPAVFPVGSTAVTFTARDGSDNEQSDTALVTVVQAATPVVVISPTGPGGASDPDDLPSGPQPTSWMVQRSDLREIVITFDVPITPPTASDLVLTNLGVNAPVDADMVISLRDDQLSLSTGGMELRISLDANQLSDGVYQLELLPAITGGETFTFTGNATNRFFVLTGDWNGSGGVNIQDFATFAYWFANALPTAPDYVDLNGSGGINIQDFAGFAANFGDAIVFPGGVAASTGGGGEGELTSSMRTLLTPTDVNGDGSVTARDALNVINELNRHDAEAGTPTAATWSKFDVNRDGQVSALDALVVINRLSPEQADPEQADPEQADPEQADPEQADPEQAVPASQPSESEGEQVMLATTSGQTMATSKRKLGKTSLPSIEAVDVVWKQESVTAENHASESEDSLLEDTIELLSHAR